MGQVIEKLSEQFDLVLLDSPAVLSVADTAMLAPMVDGVLLIVRRDQVRREAVRSAVKQLADVGANVLGVVFINSDPARGRKGYGSYRQVEKARTAAPRESAAPAVRAGEQLRVPANADRTRRVARPAEQGPNGSSGE